MPVPRDRTGRHVFADIHLGWIDFCGRLRDTGMPLPEIRRYVDLVRSGDRERRRTP